MLMEDFDNWRVNPDNKSIFQDENSAENFSVFYQNYCFGKSYAELLDDLAWQINELQVCMEGLVENI